MKLVKTYEDKEGHVAKFVFQDETAISEVVAYKYQDRGVVCFSCMSGCPIGCAFCGTGEKFIRNLTIEEMSEQIGVGLEWVGKREKLQLMAMSMGEPMLNNRVYFVARNWLMKGIYDFFISTVGVNNPSAIRDILSLTEFKRFGLQISLHAWTEETRRALLGKYKNLLSILELAQLADMFKLLTGRPAYFNYICDGREEGEDAKQIANIIGDHHLTCSVMCNTGDFIKADPKPALDFGNLCAKYGVKNWSVFNPAGQDTIGGGCGQLLYTQKFLKDKK